MTPQNISAHILLNECQDLITLVDNNLKILGYIQLYEYYFDVNQNIMNEGILPCTATMSTKIILRGVNVSKEEELCHFKKPPDIRNKIMYDSC